MKIISDLRIWSIILVFSCLIGNSQEVIPLYKDSIPLGSEIFTLKESARLDDNGEIVTIRNVSIPTLTVYRPEQIKSKGTAIIICPGGGFQGLAYQTEGTATAKWCVENGITAFILKYRLMPYPYPELNSSEQSERDSIFKPFVKLAVDDGLEAVKYVRSRADQYNLDMEKIGIIGYSAGGTIVSSVAQNYNKESRPDFVVPVYAYCGAIVGDRVPANAPPMFLAWASDDVIANGNPRLYEKWKEAGRSVEMHCFYNGGHGFSVNKQNKASDIWTILFKEWMLNQGFLKNN
ncbi:alpha/beta hydrolase [Tamlana flava]|uniref:alpha/beta hydrolase n=1 Tax=Tamlana flava TaxID=3158572 RepID=UPI00351BD99C